MSVCKALPERLDCREWPRGAEYSRCLMRPRAGDRPVRASLFGDAAGRSSGTCRSGLIPPWRTSSSRGYPYLIPAGKETIVDAAARVTSKGQVTVPKAVRDALGIREGDEVVFHVEGNRAVLARTPDFLALAGSVSVPAAKRNAAWDDVIRKTRAARSATRR